MNAIHARNVVGVASGALALCWTVAASAQQSVVVQPAQAAPAPAVVAPAAAPSPVVVEPAQAAPPSQVVVDDRHGEVEADSAHHWRPNRALLMTGLVLAGVPYIASATVAATSSHTGDADLWVPVIGPWLDVGNRGGCPANNASCGAEIGNKVLLVGDGIFQSVGVLEIAGAFIFPETVRIATVQTGKGSWFTVAPARLGAGAYGMSAVGQF